MFKLVSRLIFQSIKSSFSFEKRDLGIKINERTGEKMLCHVAPSFSWKACMWGIIFFTASGYISVKYFHNNKSFFKTFHSIKYDGTKLYQLAKNSGRRELIKRSSKDIKQQRDYNRNNISIQAYRDP